MVSPIRLAFALSDPRMSDLDFTGATTIRLNTVNAGDTVSFYKATVAPGTRFVGVDWCDGNSYGDTVDNPQVEVVYPGAGGEIVLSHTYKKRTYNPVVKITDGLSELRFSGVTLASVGRYDVTVNGFTGAAKLKSVDSVGSKIGKVLAQGMFANTGLTSIPSGYSLPSVSSRKVAPCVPLACFMNCTALTGTANLPSGAVAVDALAFKGCTSLASLSGFSPSTGLVHIGYAAFMGCHALESLSGLSGSLAAGQDVALFNSAYDLVYALAEMHPGATKGYRVDQFMLALGYNAFSGCINLTDISALSFRSGIILRGTFSGCSKLATIPSSILSRDLGTDTTHWTTGSSEYLYPGGYRYHYVSPYVMSEDVYQDALGNAARGAYERWASGGVYDGTAITEFTCSRKLILEHEFLGCTKLTSVTITSTVERVGRSAFSGCTALMSVTFQGKTMQQVRELGTPSLGVTYIGSSAQAYPFGLPSGCQITCSDGVITV